MTTMGLCSEWYGSTGGLVLQTARAPFHSARAILQTAPSGFQRAPKPQIQTGASDRRQLLPWRPSPCPDDEKQRPASDNKSVRQLDRLGARNIQLLAGIGRLQGTHLL